MNLEQTLKRKYGKVKKTRGKYGVEYRINCPVCGDDKKMRMYISPDKGVCNCFRDPAHARSLDRLLGFDANNMFQIIPGAAVEDAKLEPLPDNIIEPGYVIPVDRLDAEHPAVDYLEKVRKRPFSKKELSDTFGVLYCGQGKDFYLGSCKFNTSNTLIFPVWMFNRVIGWQARLLYDPDKLNEAECEAMGYSRDEDGEIQRPPKYYTCKFEKGRSLYNFDNARNYDYVVVTEGVFDAMSVGPSAVATFGTGISEYQARLLKAYWNTVVILLDPDGTDAATAELAADLYRSVNVIYVKLAGYKDPGDAPRAIIWEQISASISHQRKIHDKMTTAILAEEKAGGAWTKLG